MTLKKSAPIVARLLHTALRPPSYFCLAGAGCRADRDELRLSENKENPRCASWTDDCGHLVENDAAVLLLALLYDVK